MNLQTALRARRQSPDHDTATTTAPTHGSRLARRFARVVGLTVVTSALVLGIASPSGAAVRSGDGTANEHVFCNSATHQITITTQSNGIFSGQVGGPLLNPYYLSYAVYVHMAKVVNGVTVWSNPGNYWQLVTDGNHSYTMASTAGQTSNWYFWWAFQQPNGSFTYPSEWANGGLPAGWYADQRGYQSLTSCRT